MNRLNLAIITIILFSISVEGQVKIDSMFVYKSFLERGYTTAGASSRFRELKENNVELSGITEDNRNKIISILDKADCKKHRQTKFGGGMLFCLIMRENRMNDFLIEPNVIVDLTNYQNYLIED